MSRSKLVGIIAGCLFVGAVLGFFGGFYTYRIYPQVHASRAAQVSQAKLNSEVRYGSIASIGADTVVIKVSKGATDVGKTLALRATANTTIQVGSAVMNKPGTAVDLTQWYKTGDAVDVLTKDDISLGAIFRPLKQGEEPVETIQQTQPNKQ
jgi:hypothetical protein